MDVGGVVFDLYGTLLDVTAIEAACSPEVPDPKALVGLWRQKQLEYTWLRALMGRYEDFWAVTAAALDCAAERLGLALEAKAREHLTEAWLSLLPYPEVPTALGQLSARALAVLSNGSPRMLEAALRSAGLQDRFAHVLSADAVRTYKPAPQVYALAERHLGFSRAHILFVSANAWDIAGAKAFGLPVAWVNRARAPFERLGVTPDLIVSSLTELPGHVPPASS